MTPHLLIVIVNYRTARLCVDCIASVVAELDHCSADVRASVMVVDGGSGDDSPRVLADAIAAHGWAPRVQLLPLEHNGGFAYANNAGIRPALDCDDKPDYVLLLNPDTVVRPGAISQLVAFMQHRPEVGIAGSRLEDPDGTPQRSAFRFPSLWGEIEEGIRFGPVTRLLAPHVIAPPQRDVLGPTDWVAGASMIVRRAVFEAVGLLDEGYFMYYEEVDFCRRAKGAGWPCWYVPQSRVVHLVGQASGVTDIKKPLRRRPRYWFDSRRRYLASHHGRVGKCSIDAAWVVTRLIARAMDVLRRRSAGDPPHLIADYLRYNLFPRRSQT